MKILTRTLSLLLMASCSTIFAAATTSQPMNQQPVVSQQQIQAAKQGCQKKLGFFPTPAKLTCMLTAIGKTEQDIKPKAMAIIFSACQGRTMQPQAANATVKKYPTLGACLSDSAAVETINKELSTQGFNPVVIANPTVLSTQ